MFLVNKRVGFLSRAWRLASRWHGPAACERTPLTTPCWSPSRTSRTRWESCAPAPRRAHRDPGRLEVRARRFAAHARRILDAPQRPAETAQRHHLLFLLVAQDVGHPARGHALPPSSTSRVLNSVARFSAVHHWPVLAVDRGMNMEKQALRFNAVEKGPRSRTAQLIRGGSD